MFSSHAIRRGLLLSSTRSSTFARLGARSMASQAQAKATSGDYKNQQEHAMTLLGAFLGLTVGTIGIALTEPKQMASQTLSPFQQPSLAVEKPNDPPPRPDLPTIALEDVAEHCDEDSLWYTFRGAVYDLTFFINGHPGGTPVRFSNC